jgi:hypothetical protein
MVQCRVHLFHYVYHMVFLKSRAMHLKPIYTMAITCIIQHTETPVVKSVDCKGWRVSTEEEECESLRSVGIGTWRKTSRKFVLQYWR